MIQHFSYDELRDFIYKQDKYGVKNKEYKE